MTNFLTNLHFIRPAWIVLAPIAVGLWWLWQRNAAPLREWRRQMDSELLQALVVGRSSKRDISTYLLLAAWLLATVAIAGPTWKLEPNPFATDAAPLMILLKADQNMEQANQSPTRMERAHLKIADLAKIRKGQPLGLIAYAGSAHLVLPPTRDTEVVAQMAAEISPSIMPVAGDKLGLAIWKATELLQQEEQGGSLLVIADAAEIDPNSLTAAVEPSDQFPIQFLALASSDGPETESIRKSARTLSASVQTLTVDDTDVSAIVDFAERRAASGMAGESSRWQEAGYWLTPILALLVALSFRRQKLVAPEE